VRRVLAGRLVVRAAVNVKVRSVNAKPGETRQTPYTRPTTASSSSNPERGDTLVASALAEALIERAADPATAPPKRLRLLENAEVNLRTVLPVLLTSQSVLRASPEQANVVAHTVNLLNGVLVSLGRRDELVALEAAIAEFSREVAGAAAQFADALATSQSRPPPNMYA